MASEKALKVYQAFQEHLRKNNFHFDTHDERLVLSLMVNGDDLPLRTIIHVHDDRNVVQILCYMSKVPEEKRPELAVAVAVANYGIVNGSFDFDVSDGELRYRVTHNYTDCVPSDGVIRYLLGIAFTTADKYNDRFFMMCKDMMTLEQFIKKEG